ncbi:MAG: hypothetical protein VW709_16780, partial [Rickettsiales bacterium]
LVRKQQYVKVCETIKETMENERDEEFRFILMGELVLYYELAGDYCASLYWARRKSENYGHLPAAWTSLAGWYFYSTRPGRPTTEDMLKALGYLETALDKTKASGASPLYVLFEVCRVLTALKDYPKLERTMRAILKKSETHRCADSYRLEAEWLKTIPDGCLDDGLVTQFNLLIDPNWKLE